MDFVESNRMDGPHRAGHVLQSLIPKAPDMRKEIKPWPLNETLQQAPLNYSVQSSSK